MVRLNASGCPCAAAFRSQWAAAAASFNSAAAKFSTSVPLRDRLANIPESSEVSIAHAAGAIQNVIEDANVGSWITFGTKFRN